MSELMEYFIVYGWAILIVVVVVVAMHVMGIFDIESFKLCEDMDSYSIFKEERVIDGTTYRMCCKKEIQPVVAPTNYNDSFEERVVCKIFLVSD